MRRFCLLAVLAAGSTVLHAQCSNAPCIDSLQSDFAGAAVAPAHGAAITAGTPVGSAPFFWLFINGSFIGDASTTITWTGVGAPGGTSLFIESYGTSQMIVDVPTNLFASPGTATITVTQNPGNGAKTSNASTFTVNRPLAVSALPIGVVSIPYSQPLASGGTGPYNLQYVSGTVPPGIISPFQQLQSDTTLNGTPTTAGTYTFSISVSDSWGNFLPRTTSYSLTIVSASTISGLTPAFCTISTSPGAGCSTGGLALTISGTNFVAGEAVYWDSTLVGGTFVSSSLITVSIPPTLLTPGTHLVSLGAPPIPPPILSFATFAAKISSPAATITSNQFTFTVNAAPVLSFLAPAVVTAGSGSIPLSLSGANFTSGMRIVWQGPGGSVLLAASTQSPGLITTTVPSSLLAAAGTVSVSVLSADSSPVASNALPFAVSAPRPALNITTAALPPGTAGVPYAVNLTASGGDSGPYTFSISGGALPAGLRLSSDGRIAGTPASPGTSTFVVTAGDQSGDSTSVSFTLVVNPAPLTITTQPLSPTPQGSPYSVTFAAVGGVAPYKFSASGTLPPGTQFTGATLSGTPAQQGTFPFNVTVTDSTGNSASQAYSLTVTGPPLSIVTASPLPSGEIGTAYIGVQLQAQGGTAPYTWTAGSLPPGMTLSAAGALSGTPTQPGTFSISITVTDSGKATASGKFAITIRAITIATATLPNGTVGSAYDGAMAALAGVVPLTWTASGLPPGISLAPVGVLSGTPTAAGTFSVTITVTDAAGNTDSKSYSLTVVLAPLRISTSGSVPPATAGSSFNLGFTVAGGAPPYTFSASGLPSGLTISGSTGAISGSPAAPGNSNVTVTVKDNAGTTASTNVAINVTLPAVPPLTFTGVASSINPGSQSSVGVSIGSPYPADVTVNLTLSFSGTDPAVQFATGGTAATLTIPAGQTASPTNIGVQTGTVAGTVTITAQLAAGSQNITPTPAPTRTITIPASAPVIASVTATRNGSGFTVAITGYSSPRSLTTANFTFSGTNLGTTTLSIPVDTIFTSWYQTSTSSQFGSNFSYTQPFNTSNPQAVTSVSVTLVNASGTSAAASATMQ